MNFLRIFYILTLTLMVNFSFADYQPADRAELLAAVDLWDSDRDSAMNSYGHISTWDVSQVVYMTDIFNNHQTFNDDISNWDVSSAINMSNMFTNTFAFNQLSSGPDISRKSFPKIS